MQMSVEGEEADPVCVYPNLLVGSELGAADLEHLHELRVTRVLVVAPCRRPFGHEASGILYKDLWIGDSSNANLLNMLMEAIEFLGYVCDSERALVHCHAGVSRSAAVATAFIMYKEKMTFEEAFDIVKKFRPVASPNIGLIHQLKMFEKLGFAIDKSSHDYHLFCERMSLQAAREFAAVVVEVHPESDEVDLKTLEVDVRGFGSGYGIVWGESRHVPIAFDVWKIVIAASYEVKPDVDVEFILEEELAETLSLVSRVEIISQNHL